MDELIGIQVRAEVRVERGDATHCACGGILEPLRDGDWECAACGKVYE